MTANARPLRVAFVTDTIAGPLGGGVVAGRHMVDALRRDHQVVVAAGDATGPDSVTLEHFQLPLRSMRRMQFSMAKPDRRALARLFREVDVVHVQFPFWLGMVAVEEARKAGRPVVTAFHVQPENLLANIGIRWPWLGRRIYRFWVSRIFGPSDAVVVPTRFAERKLRQHGLATPIHVVSNGVPPDLHPQSLRRGSRDVEKPFEILAVGRFAAEKRQDVLIEAVRRSRHRDRIHLVLAGGGPNERRLRELARDLPGGAEVGYLSRESLAHHLATADLFVHASEAELEGIAVLEAMNAGLPVLVAQDPESAASEFALSDDFRFPSGDPGALAARIDALFEAPEILRSASARYRTRAPAGAFADGVARIAGVYRDVLGLEPRPTNVTPLVPRSPMPEESAGWQAAE